MGAVRGSRALAATLIAGASVALLAGLASADRAAVVRRAVTPLQCKQQFHTTGGRARCFAQLPGADCNHPLVAEKADDTTRGEHRYFRLSWNGDSYEGPPQGVEEHYSYAPASANVAMCPYPIGAVYKDSLLSDETHCRTVERQGRAVKECSIEYDTHNHPEPVRRSGGSFTFDQKSPRTGYLVVKGYFIHPPWEDNR